MTFTEMQDQVQIHLGDSTGTHFTSTKVQNAINRVLPQIAMQTEANLTYSDYTTSSGTQAYALPSDFLKAKYAILIISSTNHEPLHYVNIDEFFRVDLEGTTGQPEYYKIEKGAVSTTVQQSSEQIPGDLWLTPTPDNNGGSDYTVRLWYFQLPTALSSDSDISELPLYLHEAVCLKAAMDLARHGKEFELYRTLKADFRDEIALAKESIHRSQRIRSGGVKDVMGYSDLENW